MWNYRLARTKPAIEKIALENENWILYGSNFSLGVNLFFALNENLAKLMQKFSDDYTCQLEEIHHVHKKMHQVELQFLLQKESSNIQTIILGN